MQTVTGPRPSATRSAKLRASAPPQKLMGTAPPSSSVTRWARVRVRGCRARPDMYIIFSLAGKMGRWLMTSRVFESLRPNSLGRGPATWARLFTMLRASSHLGSWPKASSGTVMSKPRVSLSRPRRRSGPSRVGFSFTQVCMPMSVSRNRAMRSISAGGQPCMVERVIWLDSSVGMAMSRTAG